MQTLHTKSEISIEFVGHNAEEATEALAVTGHVPLVRGPLMVRKIDEVNKMGHIKHVGWVEKFMLFHMLHVCQNT